MIRRSKAEQIYEPLRDELLQLPVGSPAGSIRKLMHRYETSQLSITRVLGRLEREGVLERRPDGTLYLRGETCHDKKRVGLLIPDWPSASFTEVEERIRRGGRDRDLMVHRINYPINYSFRQLESTGFDAFLLIPDRALTPEDVYYIGSCPIPLVIMGFLFEDIALNCVASSPLQNGIKAASYLFGKGHRRMAMLVSEPGSSVINGRKNGFLTFTEAAGCRVEVIDCRVQHGENSQSKTRDVLSGYLEKHKPEFTAIYALSDATAMSAICTLNEYGCKVPGDISVIGADGGQQGEFFIPALTTVGADFGSYIDLVFQTFDSLWDDPGAIIQKITPSCVVERNSVRDITK